MLGGNFRIKSSELYYERVCRMIQKDFHWNWTINPRSCFIHCCHSSVPMISAITMLLEAIHTQIVLQYSSVHIQELVQEVVPHLMSMKLHQMIMISTYLLVKSPVCYVVCFYEHVCCLRRSDAVSSEDECLGGINLRHSRMQNPRKCIHLWWSTFHR